MISSIILFIKGPSSFNNFLAEIAINSLYLVALSSLNGIFIFPFLVFISLKISLKFLTISSSVSLIILSILLRIKKP